MPDVITLGELLIDFVPTLSGVSLVEAPAFVKAAGGAPANVAVGLARLGVSSGFMGEVGDDAFGRFLARTLAEASVDVSYLRFTTQARTGLSFVSLRALTANVIFCSTAIPAPTCFTPLKKWMPAPPIFARQRLFTLAPSA